MSLVIEARDLTRTYRRGAEEIRALDGVSLSVAAGEFVAVVGPSGAGKTTLIQLLGAMDMPTSGELHIGGQAVANLSDAGLTQLRREQVGFVFQHFGLVPTLSVLENVSLPGLFARRDVKKRAEELLERVGLERRAAHRPSQLSGGEMQRAAIARALINSPSLLLADEPTGNLDSVTSERIIQLLHEVNKDGLTVVVVTHNAVLAESANRILHLRDGKLTTESV